LDLRIVGVTGYVARESLGIKIKDIRRNLENTRELVDYGIFWWVTPVVLQIVEKRRQNLAVVLTAKLFGDFFLSQS